MYITDVEATRRSVVYTSRLKKSHPRPSAAGKRPDLSARPRTTTEKVYLQLRQDGVRITWTSVNDWLPVGGARGGFIPFRRGAGMTVVPSATEVARRGSKRAAARVPLSRGGEVVWGDRLSVARRSSNGTGVETRTGCRASRRRGRPLRLPRAAVSVARGPTRQARRGWSQVPRAPDHRVRLPGATVPGTPGAHQGTSSATGRHRHSGCHHQL